MDSKRVVRLIVGVLLLGAALLAAALVPSHDRRMITGAVFDAGHLVLYAVSAWILLRLLQGTFGGRHWVPWIGAFAGVAVLGLGTEFVQIFVQRDADLVDFGRDLLGGAAALLCALAIHRGVRIGRPVRVGLVGLGLALLAFGLAELVSLSRAYSARNGAFPSLCGFDDPWEARFTRAIDGQLRSVDPPSGWDATGRVGRLDLGVAAYPAFALREPRSDWSGYARLEFEVWSSEAAPLRMHLRVHDADHDQTFTDRFNRELTVQPGANHFAIALADVAQGPAARTLDLRRVEGLALFADHPDRPLTLWLDSFRLSRE